MKERIITYAEKYRTMLSRFFAVLLLVPLIFSTHSFGDNSLLDLSFEVSGIFLVGIAAFGRLWASLYISGHKTHSLVMTGPYSMVRNPLYFFSFIGAIGLGLLSENIVVLGLLFLLFVLYYPLVMMAEEKKLLSIHGEEYRQYMKRVPRFIPKIDLLVEPPTVTVQTIINRKTFFDAIWFVWLYIPLLIIERLHDLQILPVLFRVP
jgi:protein-S-isoprenylcysteine O-methyltransferase Ste14